MRVYLTFLSALALAVSLTDCAHPVEPGGDDWTSTSISVGREWVFRRQFIALGLPERPDTMKSYSCCVCTGDTTIDGKRFFIIQVTYLDAGMYSTDALVSRQYLHYGHDSVIVLVRGYIVAGVFKRLASPGNTVLQSGSSTLTNDLIRGVLTKRLAASGYDTSFFDDMYFPLVFPLVDSSTWYFRPVGDSNGNLPIKRQYIGQETVTVPAGTFLTWKMRWDYSRTFLADLGITGYDWVYPNGLIRSQYDYGSDTFFTSEGVPHAIHCYETREYLADDTDAVPPVAPILPQQAIDSALTVASQQWDFGRFRDWLAAIHAYCDTGFVAWPVDTGWLAYSTGALIEAVWGDSGIGWAHATDYLSAAVFPPNWADLHDRNGFLSLIVDDITFAQGWQDCDFAWQSSDRPYLAGEEVFPYGRSARRQQLAEYLYGRFD